MSMNDQKNPGPPVITDPMYHASDKSRIESIVGGDTYHGGIYGSIIGARNTVIYFGPHKPILPTLFDRLEPYIAKGALYNSSERAEESTSTRPTDAQMNILTAIRSWVSGTDYPVCWLHGPAATGKSTISHTIAQQYEKTGQLAASFFFSKQNVDRQAISKLIPTLAYQIAESVPAAEEPMTGVLQRNRMLLCQNVQQQFTKLIANPLDDIAPSNPFLIIVDGLDECMERRQVVELIKFMGETMNLRKIPLRFLLTSRPERDIETAFRSPIRSDTFLCLALEDSEKAPILAPVSAMSATSSSTPERKGVSNQVSSPNGCSQGNVMLGREDNIPDMSSPSAVIQGSQADDEEGIHISEGPRSADQSGRGLRAGKLVATMVKSTNLLPNDIIIAVMGPTGAGKSRFINIVTQQTDSANVGHTLESCTAEVQAFRYHRFDNNGTRSYVIVDTPGFDNTNKTDREILGLIADWLKSTYKREVHIAGIIYLHRISDNRIAGSPLKNLRMFAKLCGDDPLRNIILATTIWDRVKPGKGEERQKKLERQYWKEMLEHGSKTRRFEGSFDSAWKIIDAIPKKTIGILLPQEELVNLKRYLSETQAGIALYDQLQTQLAQHTETLRKLRDEANGNNDEQLTRALNIEYDVLQRTLQTTFDQITDLKLPWTRRLALMFSRKMQITSKIRVY